MSYHKQLRRSGWSYLLFLTLGLMVSAQTGSPPQITEIQFKSEIQADGQFNNGLLFFKDPDGDVTKVEFSVIEGNVGNLRMEPGFSFSPNAAGVVDGFIAFKIAATSAGSYRMSAALEDRAGNRSQPKEFSFQAKSVNPSRLQVTPPTLTFQGQVGGPDPAVQTLTITNPGGGTLNWIASADVSWIQVSPTKGAVPATLTISVQASGLAAGTSSGRVIVSAEGAQGSPALIPVSLRLEPMGPRTLRVPQDFSTIRSAIDAARSGETILIAAGTYHESLVITQGLFLQGQSRDVVIIQGNRQEPTIVITGARDVAISNLTVTDGSGGDDQPGAESARGGGFHIENSTVTIRNVTIQDNLRHGLLALRSTLTVRGSRILNNRPTPSGYIGRGMQLLDTTARIESNTISGNPATAIVVAGGSRVVIEGNTIERNSDIGILVGGNGVAEILNNQIIDTQPDAKGEFGRGIELSDSAKATITGNTITGNKEYGIILGDAVQAMILKNIITANGAGIDVGFSDVSDETAQAEISQNTIQNNSGCGVLVVSDEPRIRITGQGNNIIGNNPNLCGDLSKYPPGFGGGK